MYRMDKNENYFAHLNSRSNLGFLYRRFFLYPRINRYLHGRVLDVGCGLGQFIAYRQNTTGADVNPLCVNYCRTRNLPAKLIGFSRWEFADQEFDGVVIDNVLEHIDNPSFTLDEISRVLSLDGTLIVGVPGHKGYLHDADHKVFYDKNSLNLLLTQHGFVETKCFYAPWESVFLDVNLKQYCLYVVYKKAIDR
jgi:SAM-dependent methyltransferase